MRKMSYNKQSPSFISVIVFLSRYHTKPLGIIRMIGRTEINEQKIILETLSIIAVYISITLFCNSLVYILFENSITFRYATNASNTVQGWSVNKTSITVLNP